MIIKCLTENTKSNDNYKTEHGLSLYIESESGNILFDTGQSGLFSENAKKMDVSIEKTEMAIISHGHYDHGGGLKTFFSINSKASVYIHKNAFGDYYSNREDDEKAYIGLDKNMENNPQFVFIEDTSHIKEGLIIFAGADEKYLFPRGNDDLYIMKDNEFENDAFSHEISLIIIENEKAILIAGCAHNGIVNIINKAKSIIGRELDLVIGGFHLHSRANNKSESKERLKLLSEALSKNNTMYFTCHCTGEEAYKELKNSMGNKIAYIRTGEMLDTNTNTKGML